MSQPRRRVKLLASIALLAFVAAAFVDLSNDYLLEPSLSDNDKDDDRGFLARFLRLSSTEVSSTLCTGPEWDRLSSNSRSSSSSSYGHGRKPNVASKVVLLSAKFVSDATVSSSAHHHPSDAAALHHGTNDAARDEDESLLHDEVLTSAACAARAGPYDADNVMFYDSYPDFITKDPKWRRHVRYHTEPPSEPTDEAVELMTPTDDSIGGGGGFSFWKPVLIHHHLEELNDGDFVVYADVPKVGSTMTYVARLIETMVARNADLALEQADDEDGARGDTFGMRLEREYTKGDVWEYFGVPFYDDLPQYNGNFLVLRKNPQTVQFVQDWIETVEDYHLLSDEPSETRSDDQDFIQHNHEVSMLSMLLKYRYYEPARTVFEKGHVQGENNGGHAYTFQLWYEGRTNPQNKPQEEKPQQQQLRPSSSSTEESAKGGEVA